MNVDTNDDNPLIRFYDSDFPKVHRDITIKENDNFSSYGIFDDIAFYRAVAENADGTVIDLCCGSGRIGVPIANDGKKVIGVDISRPLLDKFEDDKAQQSEEVQKRLSIVHQNVAELNVEKDAALVIMPFNSFNCLIDLNTQLQTLLRISEHLKPGGRFIFDMPNPLTHHIEGSGPPALAFERTDIETGRNYERFVGSSPMALDQTQTVHGWYDRTEEDGKVQRFPYSVRWRLIFLNEVTFMLAASGLGLMQVNGGFKGEPYTRESLRLVIQAQKLG